MTLVQIAASLQARLVALTPALDTVGENMSTYTPKAGVAYQRVNLLLAGPDNPTLGDGFYRERGLFQVMFCYPGGQGAGPALARAELVRALFPRGLTLAAGAGLVRIETTPAIAPALLDGDRWCVPLRVRWSADVHP